MRLGIDFGTTRVVVAKADRGQYPVVTFHPNAGQPTRPDSKTPAVNRPGLEWYPSLCAIRGTELRTGPAAVELLRDPDWQICRSIKRLLATCGPQDRVHGWSVTELLTRFLCDLKTALLTQSDLDLAPGEPLEVAISVPANANANQRMMTVDAFRKAGFDVCRMLDEPSAAGLEYAWRRPADARVRKRHVAVYDLGGGTFDASIISMGDTRHEVITTDGIAALGGDDFDAVLLDLCLQQAGLPASTPGPDRDRWLEICRIEKERFTTSTRTLKPALFGNRRDVGIKVAEYESALRPLITQTLDCLQQALDRAHAINGLDIEKSTVVYQVGGASQLPTVGRMLKGKFARRVWKSPDAHASVAVGLAIACETDTVERLQNRFTRYFGVWRESDSGRTAWFDPVFPKDTILPFSQPDQTLRVIRRYRAAHNVGHYRFVECSRLRDDGTPGGDITPWCEVRFPMVGELQDQPLDRVDVIRFPEPREEVEEQYRCDAHGVIEVDLVNLTRGYRQTYRLHGRAA